ncbi:MAG TPA: contractile injection system tape measure protein [Chitinophagaceae bacterium]
MTKTHYIRKQHIELVFSSEDAASEYWESLSEFHKEEAHSIMAELFDRLIPEQRWVRIDSLKIDLGKLSIRSFRRDYLEQLRSSLEVSLAEAIHERPLLQADPVAVWESTIIHYLKYGTFLWETAMESSSLMSDQSSPVRDKLEEKIVERLQSSESFIRKISTTLLQTDSAMQRWTRQFSPAFYGRVKNILFQRADLSYQSFLRASVDLVDQAVAHNHKIAGRVFDKAQRLKWEMLFSTAEDSVAGYIKEWLSETVKDKILNESLLAILSNASHADKTEILNQLKVFPELFYQQQETGITVPGRLDQMMAEVLSNLKTKENEMTNASNKRRNSKRDEENIDEQETRAEIEAGALKQNQIVDPWDNKTKKEIDHDSAETMAGEQEIYIDNAGIVLLAPFIEPFFNQFGLNEENKLEDDADASLGIQLLNMVTAGSWDEEEHRLVLNKILCGRLPQWAGYRITDIPPQAKQESVELLQNIIRYWPALKSTSSEAVQQTFLQRHGKLIFKEEQWQLSVEYKTHDILLESLPWTYSVIKLPWMQYPLYVTW